MKIIILDGFVTNPGDIGWGRLELLGDLTVYDRTAPEDLIARAVGAEILLTNKTVLNRDAISQLPKLRYIGVLATGYNVVDVGAAAEKGVTVTNIPSYSTDSVAQMVFALLLELCIHTSVHNKAVHEGEWADCDDFSFTKSPLLELAGKTMGIIGFGQIGHKVAVIASAMGMKVIAASRGRKALPVIEGFRWAEIPELLSASDVVSLHCPLTPETRGLINKETIGLMKKSAFLINTSRGPVIVEKDLADALNSGRIAGAGLDVLSEEPPEPSNPLLKAANCIITPHIAWATKEARFRLMDIAADNVEAFIRGKPQNMISTG